MANYRLDSKRMLTMCTMLCLVTAYVAPSYAAACEGGGGGNKITITPSELKFKKEETLKFSLGVLNTIEITGLTTNDSTDFSVPELTGCKVKMLLEPKKDCEVEIKRITKTKTGLKRFKLSYKEGGSSGTAEADIEGL